MRLSPRQTVPPSGCARPRHRLPDVWAGSDHLRRPHCALGLPPHLSARTPTATLRPAQIIATILRAVPSFHTASSTSCHAACDLRPADFCWTSAQPPCELRGGFVSARWVGAASLTLAPAESTRWLGRRKVFPCCSALRACAALRCVASGIFRAVGPSSW
jgi:hypothetical protein